MDVKRESTFLGYSRVRPSTKQTTKRDFGEYSLPRRATVDQHSPIWKRLMVDSSARVSSTHSNSCPDLAGKCAAPETSQVLEIGPSRNGKTTPRVQNNSCSNSKNSSPNLKRRSFGHREIIDVRNVSSLNGSSASDSSGRYSMRNGVPSVNRSDPKSVNSSSPKGSRTIKKVDSQLPRPGVVTDRNRRRRLSKSLDEDLAQLQQLTKAKKDLERLTITPRRDDSDHSYHQSLTTNEIVQLYLESTSDTDKNIDDNVKASDKAYNPTEEDPELHARCQKWLQGVELEEEVGEGTGDMDGMFPPINEGLI
ncbi:uncharacterized protein LOC135489563 [Lineus longissimus]|uniref:uncharacterized protein LOC135489563 n=1 Tax=Lineus longissimus TaxID=88925 RepID=UPI00315D3907